MPKGPAAFEVGNVWIQKAPTSDVASEPNKTSQEETSAPAPAPAPSPVFIACAAVGVVVTAPVAAAVATMATATVVGTVLTMSVVSGISAWLGGGDDDKMKGPEAEQIA